MRDFPFGISRGTPSLLHSSPTRRSSDLRWPRIDAYAWEHAGAGLVVLKLRKKGLAWFFPAQIVLPADRSKSTRLNSSHANISYAVFCLKKKTTTSVPRTRDASEWQANRR